VKHRRHQQAKTDVEPELARQSPDYPEQGAT